ncbi:MAG: hypothetical protein EBS92_00695 [Proteobacteria bacterium]|nr:hypothetical protein [Pseudomonadota bacterium]
MKMGKTFFFLACAIFTQSCTNPDYFKYGKISFQATAQNDFFTYTVDDSFYKKYKNSANNKNHPRLSDEEFKMLNVLLKEKKYCIKNSFNPSFEILSRQEKIYDATFAKLIAENYNSKSVSPVSYYGRCL